MTDETAPTRPEGSTTIDIHGNNGGEVTIKLPGSVSDIIKGLINKDEPRQR